MILNSASLQVCELWKMSSNKGCSWALTFEHNQSKEKLQHLKQLVTKGNSYPNFQHSGDTE